MTTLRFIGDLAVWQALLLILPVSALAWWFYFRESRQLGGLLGWLLPTCRALAIALALFVLTAPVLHHRYREGEPGRLRFLIDSSQSMSVTDRHFSDQDKLAIAQSLGWMQTVTESSTEHPEALQRFDQASRFGRTLDRLLLAGGGLLNSLKDEFEITVERFDRQRQTIWESTLEKSPLLPNDPAAWVPTSYGSTTQLGVALASSSRRTSNAANPQEQDASTSGQADQSATENPETVVLFSDGRNTSGISPLTVAEQMAAQRRPVYIVGLGGPQVPEDITMLAVEHPERVFEKDMLRGTLVVRTRMQKPAPMRIMIKLGGEVVWEETRTLSSSDRGRVEFAFAVKPLVEALKKQAGRSVDLTSVPLHLEASVEPQAGEADVSNNRRMFHVSVVTKRSRLLLADGRSRWEMRYLHNMFERDPAWHVDIVLPDYRESPPRLPRGLEANQWPSTKERMLEYDLIILGELPASVVPRESLDWLKAFVESSGGGLIVIDGARGALRDPLYRPIHPMLPIDWIADAPTRTDPVGLHLTSAARQLAVFQLTPLDPGKNEAAWAELPPLHQAATVKALPGSEVLATYSSEGEEIPLMVTRQYGAGRVFYSGTDESWRWRYKVADTYHQRFWNQVGRWVMRLPMSVQGQFVSIDSGKLVYQPGEPITIRSRLRGAQGEPAVGLAVEAIVTEVDSLATQTATDGDAVTADGNGAGGKAGRVVAVVPLQADASIQGVYAGEIQAPASGNYHVTIVAPGLTSEALDVHSEFAVAEPDTGEMDQLNCDEALLKKLAQETGGQYLSEAQGHELVDLLRPLSRGKIVESDSLLWQSYWWFTPIVLLLSIEWWLRKRAGLI